MATEIERLTQELKQNLNSDELTNCMRCGFCLHACPTYLETGFEAASPRGRIALMKAVADGIMEPDQQFKEQMDLCLGCRACEPACPSDVQYGELIEQAKESIANVAKKPIRVKAVQNLFMKQLFPKPKRMRLLGGTLKLYQKTGLRSVVRGVGIMKLFPRHLREMEAILPDAANDGVIARWLAKGYAAHWENLASGERMLVIPAGADVKSDAANRVGLFRGCIMDVLFTETNVNTVRLLHEAGYEVVIPDTQTCCGALHAHSGEMQQAKDLAVRNIDIFKAANVAYVASNAGGCGALLTEYDHLMKEDSEYKELAVWFAKAVKDVTELIDQGVPLKLGQKNVASSVKVQQCGGNSCEKVTYQDSCHLRNVMRVRNEPRSILTNIPGVEFQELQGADQCCGSAGIYNITQPKMSSDLIDHKMENVDKIAPQTIVTSNPGCLLQMKWGIHRSGHEDQMRAVHLVDLLAEHLDESSTK